VVRGENLAYIIYTSGSTGRPKGTLLTYGGLLNYLIWCRQAYPLAEGKGSPVHSALTFDLTITSLFSPLLGGGRVELLAEELGVEGLSTALRAGGDYSLVKLTPAHLELLNQQIGPEEAAGRTRAFVIGGENLSARSIAFWQKNAPETLLINEYGPTEAVVGCCVYQVPRGEERQGFVPIGKPIINTRLYILDRDLRPVPIGVAGELHIGGVGLARGYLNRPDLTAEKFMPDPYGAEPGARLYRTGDLARYLPDGNIECLGRTDFQVKIRGFRIELGEIEAVLVRYPDIEQGAVISWESPQGDRRLVAFVVPKNGKPADATLLREHLKRSLPEYMVPAAWVSLKALPLNSNGKVDRKALFQQYSPEWQVETKSEEPQTMIEKKLSLIWKQILGLKKVGRDENFFNKGGHSLTATQLVQRMRNDFQVEMQLRTAFEAATLSEMAKSIETLQQEESKGKADSAKTIEKSDMKRDKGFFKHMMGKIIGK
jgi:amino acid adenylation domain-containing protein